MKKLIAILFLLTAVTGVYAQQKYALVIGNGNYTNFGSLPNAVNDANDMTAALQGLGFTVDKVLDGNWAQMSEGITRLKNRLSVAKNSYGFFFYAGHGVQNNGVNYLIPAKANIPNANYLGDAAISVQTMLAELNDAGNDLNIVVLDACRDFPAAWARSVSRGLTVVANQPADSIIVYATSAGSTASDGAGRNGLFTSHLLENLKQTSLEVTEVFRRTGADVARASNRTQIPAIYSQFFETAYLGAKPVAVAPVQPAPVQPAPVQPAPVQPAPVQPVALPVQPAPAPAVQPAPKPVAPQSVSAAVGNITITSDIAGVVMIDGEAIGTRIKAGGTVTMSNINTGSTEVAVRGDDGKIVKAPQMVMVQQGQTVAATVRAPAAIAPVQPAPAPIANEDYVLPYSSTRELTDDDLRRLTKNELRLARNEIYARYGRVFRDQSLQKYFDSKPWYKNIPKLPLGMDPTLTKLERSNIELIQVYEAR